ncbi:MAG: insulinase family protein [Firmicutes bacterium]|nr:insulinase family protein [Bacillota bacterium]
MKSKIIILCFCLLGLQFIALGNISAQVEFSQELFEELAENTNEIPWIEIPDYEKIVLDNGMTVYLAEDHEMPVVQIFGYIKGGISQETIELAGISQFLVRMMNTGTKNYSEEEFAYYKERYGINFSVYSSNDYFGYRGNALIFDQEELIKLAAEVLQHPSFDTPYYQRTKYFLYNNYQQTKADDDYLAAVNFYKNLYKDHPYAYSSDVDLLLSTLNNITPASLEEFHKQNFTPANLILGLVGDIDIAEIKKMVKEYFADWQGREVVLQEAELQAAPDNWGKIIIIDKPDATQARIKMGYLFKDNSFLERVPFNIANSVFGGGDFESRLMEKLRSEMGYVYNIGSYVRYNKLAGDFIIDTNVRPQKACETIEMVKGIMNSIKDGSQAIKDKEVYKIINRWNAHYPQNYRYIEDVFISIIYNIELMNRDVDYINKYVEEYNKVDGQQAQEVFVEYTYPERFLTVIVGKKEDILPTFKEKGIDVEVVSIN